MDHHPHGHHDEPSVPSYELRSEVTEFPVRRSVNWTFEVTGPHGRPHHYVTQHERDLHLIVVRNDLSTFLHVHPELGDDGVWNIDLEFPEPGEYSAFADVSPDDAGPMTLRLPLSVPGEARPDVVHQSSTVTEVDGYRVELIGDVIPREGSDISFRITRGGAPVMPDPYLGAAGHLVAIRAGDLEYLHVHPTGGGEGRIDFMMHAPSPGLYRLFLQFSHEGAVRTADFALESREP